MRGTESALASPLMGFADMRFADQSFPASGIGPAASLATWPLAAGSHTVVRSRDLMRGVLTGLGFNGETVDDGVVMVSELVTNAMRHAVAPFELRLYRSPRVVVCEVVDGLETLPKLPSTGRAPLTLDDIDAVLDPALLECGRGLDVVHRLSQGWCGAYPTKISTTIPTTTGKAVAFALPLPDIS
ncbi:ATP-binding protein [Acrocarpospora catenulata]|uniref:ATP-binding protein n=1 Tax=Acrocarpospora catenulata TaxID=2836182 RepID=UPI001BD9A0C4|nr:ATP-binding protein [Acrocarpospora catenulata]